MMSSHLRWYLKWRNFLFQFFLYRLLFSFSNSPICVSLCAHSFSDNSAGQRSRGQCFLYVWDEERHTADRRKQRPKNYPVGRRAASRPRDRGLCLIFMKLKFIVMTSFLVSIKPEPPVNATWSRSHVCAPTGPRSVWNHQSGVWGEGGWVSGRNIS